MKMKYSFDWMKVGRSVGGQRIVGALVLLLTVVSCAIENDIPYPIVEANIESMTVEGQRGADQNSSADAIINKAARTVTLYVNDGVDLSNLRITSLKITSGAELLADSAACKNYDKFPTTGFASLDSIPLSSDTRMDFTNPVTFTLRTYQDYVWRVTVNQIIQRDIEVEGMTDYVIDANSRVVIVYVGKDQDLTNLNVTKMNLGGEYGTVSPDPTTIKDYSSPVRFNVRRSWEEYSYEWTVYVYKKSDESGESSTEEFAMVTRAIIKGKVQSGKELTVEYRKQNSTSWDIVPASNVTVSGTSFTAVLTGLNESTTYNYRVIIDGISGSEQTFTTGAPVTLQNGSMDDWSEGQLPSGNKYYIPNAAGSDFWDTGNSATAIYKTNVTTPTTDSYSKNAALLKSQNALGVKMASGNLFIGKFAQDPDNMLDGLLEFGKPFNSYPTGLRFYYKYISSEMCVKGQTKLPPELTGLIGKKDSCHIYIALSDKAEPYVIKTNANNRQLFNKNDANIIAYGEFISGESISEYKRIDIPLTYRSYRKPTLLIIVCSSSKYGDYYLAGEGSTLWLDEMELVYE